MQTITSKVCQDEITKEIGKIFDYEFTGESSFTLHKKPIIKEEFNIGLIVGASGSGKSLLLEDYGEEKKIRWENDLAIVSHFSSSEDAIEKLTAVGFNTIPSWMKPYRVLSNGEQYRANLARKLKSNCVIDEFTSVVDRNIAKACSFAVQKYIRKHDLKNIVFASCHFDVVDWLQPDWIYNTDTKKFRRRLLQQRPEIKLNIFSCDSALWEMCKKHHYLTSTLNKAGRCFACFWEETFVGFCSVLPMPSGHFKNGWRGHRTVILPDFQGFGIGPAFSNAVAQLFVNAGYKYYSRTTHPSFGNYREKHTELWRPTSANKTNNMIHKGFKKEWGTDINRICFSHEYIAKPDSDINIFTVDKEKGFFY